MKIAGSITIITGASSGIGYALAKELDQRGAKLVLAARSKDKLETLAKELQSAVVIPADMRKKEDIRHLIGETKKQLGRIDILVNNAGQGLRAPVEKIDLEEYHNIMETNVFGVLEAMQAAIPVMRGQGGGMILNVSSLVSKNYFPGIGAYASTKYALNALSLTAREELKKDNIIVSVFHPKMTATDFGKNALGTPYNSSAGRPGMTADTPEAVAKAIAKQIESETAEAQM